MLWAIVVVVALLLGFKLAPPYMEFMTIQKLLRSIATDAQAYGENYKNGATRDFALKASIDNIQSVSHNDLQVRKEGQEVVITVDYTVRVPLVGNLSACIDFNATSKK
jgi:hypothetical protein